MKRTLLKLLILLSVIAVLTVMTISGCATTETATPAETEAPAATEAPADEPADEPAEPADEPAEVQTLDIGFYADGADSYYQVMFDVMAAVAEEDPEVDWNIDYKIGQNTAAEQLQAVEDFITAGYDAIVVIQNSVDTTSECIRLTQAAGIPYFGAGHTYKTAANAKDGAGSVCYNFIDSGMTAGQHALENGVTKVVMIEGQLGQGTASDQSLGYLLAYEEAGKSLGGYSAKEVSERKSEVSLDGTQEIEVVFWASGGWFSDPAQRAMTDAITSLGVDGFDGVYAHNNPMMEGVLFAFEEAGLNPSDYHLASQNGREISWQWVRDGIIQVDSNQSAGLEGVVLHQQIKSYFKGEDYRKYLHPYLTPYDASNIDTVDLVPFSDVDAFMEGYRNGDFVIDINDPKFTDIEGH